MPELCNIVTSSVSDNEKEARFERSRQDDIKLVDGNLVGNVSYAVHVMSWLGMSVSYVSARIETPSPWLETISESVRTIFVLLWSSQEVVIFPLQTNMVQSEAKPESQDQFSVKETRTMFSLPILVLSMSIYITTAVQVARVEGMRRVGKLIAIAGIILWVLLVNTSLNELCIVVIPLFYTAAATAGKVIARYRGLDFG